MTKEEKFTDEAGDAVLAFQSAAHNLTGIAELTRKVLAIAEASHWRRYRTALGVQEWRDAEFDYFLIASELSWDDVSKVIAWNNKGSAIAPLMDHDAPTDKRRSLADASAAWHAPGFETLSDMAARLGWTEKDKPVLRRPPVSVRALIEQSGPSWEERAQNRRAQKIPPARRRQLEAIADELTDIERRYLASVLRDRSRTEQQWRTDAKAHNWKAAELAEIWKITRMQAHRRLSTLRDNSE